MEKVQLIGDDFEGIAFDTFRISVTLSAESPADLHLGALFDPSQVRATFPFPGGHIVSGSFDDRLSVPVLIDIIGSDADVSYHFSVHRLLTDKSDGAADLDAV